ncbi:MAG: dienelactone hydrolase family protein [Candidatus Poribacteria bacterium]
MHQSPGVVDSLPVFYEAAAGRLTCPLSWSSGGYDEFELWRTTARRKVVDCLFAPPPPAPYDVEIVDEQDRGSYVARKIALNISGDSRVLAYMLVPKGGGPFPACLLLHGHGARFEIGKEKVVRPWGSPAEREESAGIWVGRCHGGRWIGDTLAERGYVCFATDALNWGDRDGAGYDGQHMIASDLMHLGMSFAGLIAHEDTRAAEFLAERTEVDGTRVAAVGLSMGAFRAWQVAALSDRIGAGIAICCMGTASGLIAPGGNQATSQSSFATLHPGVFDHLDYPDVASIACPKPLLVYNGLRDGLVPTASVREAYAKMRAVWESQGVGHRLITKLWDVPHEFSRNMQEEAFTWLDQLPAEWLAA